MNGSNGGAALLKQPELIYRATQALRRAVPSEFPVSVKVRLGWDDISQAFEIADAVEQGGATEITVHGRTKADGYRADRINWKKIGEIRERLSIPVIANGEIWHWQDGQDCLSQTGCQDLMVGRGALNIPNLSHVLKSNVEKIPWCEIQKILKKYANVENEYDSGFYHVARIKQWLRYLNKEYDEANQVFDKIKTCQTAEDLKLRLNDK